MTAIDAKMGKVSPEDSTALAQEASARNTNARDEMHPHATRITGPDHRPFIEATT